MPLAPGLLPTQPGHSPAQQELAQAMPAADEILVGIFPRSAQVPDCLVGFGRRLNLRQQARSEQLRQLPRIAPIRLDPLSRLPRNQGRRHHGTLDSHPTDPTLQRIPARARFVAEPHPRPRRERQHLPHHLPNRAALRRHLPLHGPPRCSHKHSHTDRDPVCVQSDGGDTLSHDRLLSYAALVPLPSATNPRYYDREPVVP
jgi:hypothetical protein